MTTTELSDQAAPPKPRSRLNPVGLLGRAGPLALIVGPAMLMAGGLTMPGVRAGAIAAAVLLAVLAVLAAGYRIGWVRLLPGLLAIASVTWSNWLLASPRELEPALLAGLRVGYFVVPGVVCAAFIDPAALGDQLGQRLRIPARPVLAAVAGLQRLDTLAQDWQALIRARRIRGLGPTRSPLSQARHYWAVTFALLVQALRQAERASVAMEARGYGLLARPGHRRTWWQPAPFTGADVALLAVCAALAALPTALHTLLS
ncbi:energy-coupling factor transporter transmembrane protein EcfT [Kineosphaera limosa]|uniref:Putative ABC transporter permease protein n=1 Tax=Kineosphaera limosa NBRC 100340 TaxID=1184609 RepID=K6VM83_9MICO|nr:energy-coupling factor transporter transmembrane component T [Kineosphaera limosa]NYE01627.1 energy-coupling factor transporter transmembrane protein EcfT [Kineosphaera limosa]GAB97298.1 putative ABC transporter permease protein [Kineosphaera limosa NBRC 100340]